MIVAASSTPLYVSPTSRQDSVPRADDTDPQNQNDDKRVERARPDYSFLLAMLATATPADRADTLKKLPADTASLLDRLLNGAPTGGESGTLDGETSLSANAKNGEGLSREEALATARATMATVDSMRYGMMQEGALNGAATITEQTLRGAIRGDARSLSVEASRSGSIENSVDNLALANVKRTLARIAGKRGVSQEQLLALGDTRGARMRGQIDSVLAYAGTGEGAALADRLAQTVALAAATAASASDVTIPVRDTNALAPDLRARLDRVISRMRDEYGSDVSVVETARSQERQDFLYAQGRTREGAVVTWTHDSAHTRGEAVDVLVDGKWNNAEGFARLQRIAREEGLRTLGLKDPGHLELVRNGAQTDAAANVANMIERRTATLSNVSTQSGIASVASVANVAAVASVARPGVYSSAPREASREVPREVLPEASRNASREASRNAAVDANGVAPDAVAPDAVVTAIAAGNAGNGRGAASRDKGDSQKGSTERDEAARASISERSSSRSRFDTSAAERAYSPTMTAATTPVSGAADASATMSTSGISSVERVADIQQLKADAQSGSLSRMTLELDGVNGPERITVDVRGNVIDTQITTDAANADRLRMRTGELQDALSRHGLSADSVSISSNARTEATTTRPLVTEREVIGMTQSPSAGNGADAQLSGQSTRDRAMAREWEKNEDARKARDEQRNNAERQTAERQSAGQRSQRGTYNEGAR